MSGSGSNTASQGTRSSLEMGNSDQELLSKSRSRCSRKTLLIIFGLGAAAVILIVTLVLTLGQTDDPSSEGSANPLPGYELDDYLNGRFSAKRFNGTWVSDNQIMFRDAEGAVAMYDALTNTTEVVLTSAQAPVLMESFMQELSADRKFLLLGYAYEKLFRHTFFANYTVVDMATKVSTPITAPDGTKRLQLVKWSPVGNALVLVHENNIYYKTGVEAGNMRQLTSNGKPGLVYNGVPDWVYEEEVLGSNEALWFSPDGQHLAYGHFDDSEVRLMQFPWYGVPSNFAFQYPYMVNISYPKPGTPNPNVLLNVIDLIKAEAGDAVSVPMKVPAQVGAEHILATVTWSKNTEVAAVWMNRVQNIFVVSAHNADTGSGEVILEHSESAGWVDLFSPPHFSTDGSAMLVILPQTQGSFGAYRHLTLVTRQAGQGSTNTALTKGQFVVTNILAWDQTLGNVYYLATSPQDPAQQNLYSVSDKGTPVEPVCVSCGVKVTENRLPCTYVSASFSTAQSYYTLSCNGRDVPGTIVFTKGGVKQGVWEDNANLAKFVGDHASPTRKRLFVDVPGGHKAFVQLWLPPDMDVSGNTKYPMLVNVYGGPDSSQVSDRFVGDWGTYLSTNRSIIYAAIDGRGSGLKGNKMLFSGYRNLGTVEIQDQINVTKYLQDTLPYIDKNRCAIWGWSYGGYSTGMSLAQDSTGVFRCGMAVAPVTDWIYYDSIYTERYMGLPIPDDNLNGYAQANLMNQVDNLGLNDNRFMLIHGNADDNVHYQQSMMLSRVLEQKDILFSQQSYPDEAHGLNGVTPHLYHTLEKFLDTCLDLPKPTRRS